METTKGPVAQGLHLDGENSNGEVMSVKLIAEISCAVGKEKDGVVMVVREQDHFNLEPISTKSSPNEKNTTESLQSAACEGNSK